MNKKPKSIKAKGMIVVDPGKCVACKTCELQCAVAHSKSKDLRKAIGEEPLSKPRVKVKSFKGGGTPLQCKHCENAPCIKICPVKAISRVDKYSPVLIDDEVCTGCKKCIPVCPFGAIKMDEKRKKVVKCDFCIERLKKGEKPACVVACPTHALKFMLLDETTKEKRTKYLVNYKNKVKV